jgi:hypothetical protein
MGCRRAIYVAMTSPATKGTDIPDDGILGMDAIKELGFSIETKNDAEML